MKIFISYRRDDSADITGRIYDRLAEEFGRDSIYRDLDAIPYGVDFPAHIDQALKTCDVFLAVIGSRWMTITGKSGKPRIEEPNDFVRLEIATALKRNIPVIPLFIGGVTGLDPSQLPPGLKRLSFRNGISIRSDPDFHSDVNRLIRNIKRHKRKVSETSWRIKPTTRKIPKIFQGRYRWLLVALFVLVCAIGGIVFSLTTNLPPVDDLKNRVSQFETTRILDRKGNLLAEIVDPNAGRRTYVTMDQISPELIAATLAVDDQTFYSNPGFDLWSIVLSRLKYGSNQTTPTTITQKLASLLLLSPDEIEQKNVRTSLREIYLANQISRKYSKDEILEIYLNELYYGNSAYGIEAAANTYFSKSANDLNLAEASFLAGLPESPAKYDIYTNRDETLQRHQQVLVLMFQLSQTENCINVSNSQTPVCIDVVDATNAANEMRITDPSPPRNIHYPHWVQYIRTQLEQQYDPQTLYQNGFSVYTTIDPNLQDAAQQVVSKQISTLADKHVTNGALVAIKPSTGEILAMVGSPDYNNAVISGQINNAVDSTRNPGSLLQPIVYIAAFEKGWTPATWIPDDKTELPESRQSYPLENFDQDVHGMVRVRTALSNSYNIPAIKAINFVGLYDGGILDLAALMGITSLTGEDYDLSLPVDGGNVSLLEMTGAYSVFANLGQKVPPVSIIKIVDHDGKLITDNSQPSGEQVIRPEHAFLITSILSDNDARTPSFGTNSVLNLSFPAAVTTGTTYDYGDAWTIGYTPDIVVGVWVGNTDGSRMLDVTGINGAAPIWAEFLDTTINQISGGNPTSFPIPTGIVERSICTEYVIDQQTCATSMNEYFASDQQP